MRETKKMYVGLATIMMSILLGAALVAPAGTAFAWGSGSNHENESKDKDRKDKGNDNGNGNECGDDKKKGKECNDDNKCDDGKKKGHDGTNDDKDKYCKIKDLNNDITADKNDLTADGPTIDLKNDQKAVKDAKDKLDSDKKAHKSKSVIAADEAALDAAQNKLDKDKDHNQDVTDDMKDLIDDNNELNALLH
jgi:hypothetical protein